MRPELHNVRFTRALLATATKASLSLRTSFAMQIAFMALNNLTFFVFWWVLMRRVPSIGGWRLGDIELLFGVVAVSVGLTSVFAGGLSSLGRTVVDGQLDTLLLRPKPVLVQVLGMRSQAFGIGDVLSGMALIVLSGEVPWRAVPVAVFAMLGGAVVFLASGIVFFSLAFWLDRADGLARQLWDLLITFSLYPEPLFGGSLRLALFTILPAGFVGFLPARLARQPSVAEAVALLIAAAVYLRLATVVFAQGLRRYESGSRFSVLG